MVKIISNLEITKPIKFAIEQLDLRCKQMDISFALELIHEVILEPQAYNRIYKADRIVIKGNDESSIMYGILDLEQEIKHKGNYKDIEDKQVEPFIKSRGIKINIPLDARTPSYSDASDSAFFNIKHMWDFNYWKKFLDLMALNRYNVLSLWSLSPFPSLVSIPEYPNIALEDVKISMSSIKADLSGRGMYTEDMKKNLVTIKKMSIEEKVDFWQSVMEYAKDRCIKIFIITWNLFVYGTETNSYGITEDQNNPITKDYIYCGVKALMDTYPLLAGIGVTAGENMQRDETDIPFIADSYGRAVKDYLRINPDREFRFIHRMQYTHYESIINEFQDFPCEFGISFKYSQAHMYSSTKPSFIDDFLNNKAPNLKIWLTLRNDDFYMYRWGNPEYARQYIQNLPASEMFGYYMGADGYTWGRDYMDNRDNSHPNFLEKMWYMFLIWGNLSYNINIGDEFFRKEIEVRLGIKKTELFEAWQYASDIIPLINQVHWHDYDFQWYPEGCCMYDFEQDKLVFANIHEFMTCPSIPSGNYYSVSEYCKLVENEDELTKIDPLSCAELIWNNAKNAVSIVENIRTMSDLNQELIYTLDDIEALCYLGFYYALKLEAATNLERYGLNHVKLFKEEAVRKLKEASQYWRIYSSKSKKMYKAQVLTRLSSYVDVERFNRLVELDVLLAEED